MSKIPVFDLGNVLIHVNFQPFVDWVLKKNSKLNSERVMSFHRSSLYYELEFGKVSESEFIRRLCQQLEIAATPAQFTEQFCDIFPGAVAGMPELLQDLAKQGPVYGLSNTNALHAHKFFQQFAAELAPLNKLFVSHELGYRKPYPGIYREVGRILEKHGKDFIFFDDLPANIAGAQAAGWEAHLFTSAEQVRELCGLAAKSP